MRYYPPWQGNGKGTKTVMIMKNFLVLQVVIICFVRKGLDKVFTQRELRWLDEILPSMARARKGSEDSNDSDTKTVRLFCSMTLLIPTFQSIARGYKCIHLFF